MRLAWTLPLLPVLVGCAGAPPGPARITGSPIFDPFLFFAGHTEGVGRLHVVAKHAHAVRVHGSGTVQSDGSLRLTQTVDEEGKPPARRAWRLERAGPNHYVGTLTDAVGPIVVDAVGNRLRIRFQMAHGLATEQWLVLQPGGQAAQNRMTVRKFGIVVATLDETITRTP